MVASPGHIIYIIANTTGYIKDLASCPYTKQGYHNVMDTASFTSISYKHIDISLKLRWNKYIYNPKFPQKCTSEGEVKCSFQVR